MAFLYVTRWKALGGGDREFQWLHLAILGITEDHLQGDHFNRDRLDNRRANLRVATHMQNMRNRSVFSTGTSKYRGVDWCAARGKWRAQIHLDGKSRHVGLFVSEEEAAVAYDNAAKAFADEFSCFNFS